MAQLRLIDTFPHFLAFWREVASLPVDAQIAAWEADYMARWPALLQKQQADYAADGNDWREIAATRVFPLLEKRLPAMRAIHDHLLALSGPTFSRAAAALDLDADVVFVLYVGIGCGAGWVTTYEGYPAVLFGLENAAEEGWMREATLRGLIAHELGHVVHFHRRALAGRAHGGGPWWQLYTEGFAQRCEHLALGSETWHMAGTNAEASPNAWISWCCANRRWLAQTFLHTVARGAPVRPFFGSWYSVREHKQTGYFLGHEVIRRLEAHMDLQEIAVLDDFATPVAAALQALAAGEETIAAGGEME